MKNDYSIVRVSPLRYRGCTADEILRHGASVVGVATSSHHDSLTGYTLYAARITFSDGVIGDMRSIVERERDAFAAEFSIRIRAAA